MGSHIIHSVSFTRHDIVQHQNMHAHVAFYSQGETVDSTKFVNLKINRVLDIIINEMGNPRAKPKRQAKALARTNTVIQLSSELVGTLSAIPPD